MTVAGGHRSFNLWVVDFMPTFLDIFKNVSSMCVRIFFLCVFFTTNISSFCFKVANLVEALSYLFLFLFFLSFDKFILKMAVSASENITRMKPTCLNNNDKTHTSGLYRSHYALVFREILTYNWNIGRKR